ncbi:hypothetical protein V8G54_030671 [Vigna mungo]|uniref:Uncharacterized protein n=1 Tax=Vigna mungo TaxID=3915 RepID=A0AAQ3MX62_VIGMU
MKLQLELHQEVIPLLIEACFSNPSLLERKKRKSKYFVQCSFNYLEKVLLFLKNNKIKDMNDVEYDLLQHACEEVQCFSFNLEWLKPFVDSALEMKHHVKKFHEVKRWKKVSSHRITKRLF